MQIYVLNMLHNTYVWFSSHKISCESLFTFQKIIKDKILRLHYTINLKCLVIGLPRRILQYLCSLKYVIVQFWLQFHSCLLKSFRSFCLVCPTRNVFVTIYFFTLGLFPRLEWQNRFCQGSAPEFYFWFAWRILMSSVPAVFSLTNKMSLICNVSNVVFENALKISKLYRLTKFEYFHLNRGEE